MTSSSERGEPLSRKSLATRTALVDGALSAIAALSYRDTKVTDICAAGGRSVGLFYKHFENKEDIFAACVERFYERLIELSPPRDEAEVHLKRAIEVSIAAYWHTYREYNAVLAGLFEIGMSDAKITSAWKRIRRNALKRLSVRITDQQKIGRCRDLNPELMASALFSMIEFSCYNWNTARLDFPGERVGDDEGILTLVQLVLKAMEID